MANLNVDFMGLKLKNPIIAGSCTLSSTAKEAQKLENAGVAAIVYRSLFEEQIQMERAQLDDKLEEYTERNAEMTSLFPALEHAGPQEHIIKLTEVKNSVTNNVRRETISDRIWIAKGDSASSIPAKNAPRAGDRPNE